MGCFAETCFLTNTPIEENDDCYAIVFRYPEYFQPKSPGDMKSLSSAFVEQFGRHWERTIYGKYNDYGGIKGESVDSQTFIVLFVSPEAWEIGKRFRHSYHDKWDSDFKMLSEMKKMFDAMKGAKFAERIMQDYEYADKPLAEETLRAVMMADAIGKPLFSAKYGRQDYADYIDFTKSLAEATLARCSKV